MAVSRRTLMQVALAPAALAAAQDLDMPPTVSRVHPGTDGKLDYVPDEQGNVIHDCSHAGYGGGGVPIPTVPVKETVWPVAGDNTANLQAAIDKVSALPPDRNGFRGAVLIKMGYYNVATPLNIHTSGVVLRGEGMGDTGTILIGTGTGRPPAPRQIPPLLPLPPPAPKVGAAEPALPTDLAAAVPRLAAVDAAVVAADSPRSSGSPAHPAG